MMLSIEWRVESGEYKVECIASKLNPRRRGSRDGGWRGLRMMMMKGEVEVWVGGGVRTGGKMESACG